MSGSLLVWRDEYLIGVEELDFEHKDLFTRLNELHGELSQHEEKDNIMGCLGEILTRITAHFALEEHYMRTTKCPGYEQHKQEHDEFLEVIVDNIEKFRNDPEPGHGDTLEYQIRNWIVNHITTSDQEMVAFQSGKQDQ